MIRSFKRLWTTYRVATVAVSRRQARADAWDWLSNVLLIGFANFVVVDANGGNRHGCSCRHSHDDARQARRFLCTNKLPPRVRHWPIPRAVLSALLAFPIFINSPPSAAQQPEIAQLPAVVKAELKKHKLPADSLSVYVQEVGRSYPLLAVAPDVSRNPASVMKVVTTFAALKELGPGYRWETDVRMSGELKDGRLRGDLYLKGDGDPFLVTETFWAMLRRLRVAGVQDIDGDLIIDSSYFSLGRSDNQTLDGKPHRVYNVVPNAMLLNFNATRFSFWPRGAQNRVDITAEPPSTTVRIQNDLVLTKGRCRGKFRRLGIEIERKHGVSVVRFHGEYPAKCAERALTRTVNSHRAYLEGVFRAIWSEMGGKLRGKVREARLPNKTERLFRWPSRSLSELVRGMNKFSNNVMARHMLLTMGAKAEGAPGTVAKGRRAVARWAAQYGVSNKTLSIDNGAGLSRRSRSTARAVAKILLAGHADPLMPELVSSLPLSAIDGTLRRRFRKTPMAGRLHMKTGLLNHVRTIAGYMVGAGGRTYAIVMLQNHPDVHMLTGTAVQDVFLKWLYELTAQRALRDG